jgi:hypothetical protein
MLLPVLLMTLYSAVGQSGTPSAATTDGKEDAPNEPAVCEVLKHAAEYVGRHFTFTGVVTSYEHGAYFVPYPPCAGQQAIRVQDFPWGAYRSAGGGKGLGLLATVNGKIVVRPTAVSIQKRGGPRKQTVFSVKHVSDLKRAP